MTAIEIVALVFNAGVSAAGGAWIVDKLYSWYHNRQLRKESEQRENEPKAEPTPTEKIIEVYKKQHQEIYSQHFQKLITSPGFVAMCEEAERVQKTKEAQKVLTELERKESKEMERELWESYKEFTQYYSFGSVTLDYVLDFKDTIRHLENGEPEAAECTMVQMFADSCDPLQSVNLFLSFAGTTHTHTGLAMNLFFKRYNQLVERNEENRGRTVQDEAGIEYAVGGYDPSLSSTKYKVVFNDTTHEYEIELFS